MGRGSSKASIGGGTSVTAVTMLDGSTLQLEIPLTYGGKDKGVSNRDRATLEAWEDKKRKAKVENAMLLGFDGSVIEERRGGKHSVSTYMSAFAETLTHNHPRDDSETLGGTFSKADLQGFVYFKNMKTKRATAAEGTYSISKTNKFDSDGFNKFLGTFGNEGRKKLKTDADAAYKEFKNGGMDFKAYSKKVNSLNNNFLIGLHNELISNQKKYGYTYTLEKKGE